MSWLQVQVSITPEQAAKWEDRLLDAGAVSVTFVDGEDQPIYEPDLGTTPLWQHTHLLALFEQPVQAEQITALLSLYGEPVPELTFEEIADQDWERSWMDDFHPMQFGQRLWIVPSWHQAPNPDAVNILLDPGLAFGTGTHPTTALCLQWLDGEPLTGQRLLDFGCGSGILAIAGLLLGAASAVGTDIDPQALQASRDNAQRNQIQDSDFALYLPEAMPNESYQTVVANILAGPLVELAPVITGYTQAGTRLALSGILAEQAEEVRAAYQASFTLDPTVEQDGWVLISGTRNP